MGFYHWILLRQLKARFTRASRQCSLLFLVVLFMPDIALAQTTHPSCNYGGCSTPPAPAQPTITPNPSLDGNFEVKVYNSDPYSWIVWNTGQTSPGNWSDFWAKLNISNAATGTYSYQAYRCIWTGQSNLCSGWSPARNVNVVRMPGNPSLALSAPSCGTLNASWSPASTNYPASSHVKRYDVEQSIDGVNYAPVPERSNTTETAWPHQNPQMATTYWYRVRAWYVWTIFGYTSGKTDWVSASVTMPSCVPPTPNVPVLSQPAMTGTQINVSWSAQPPGGVTIIYSLERRNLTTGSSWTAVYSGSNTGYADNGTRGHTHEYRAQACNPAPYNNCSAWSSTVAVDVYQMAERTYRYDVLGRLIQVVKNGTTSAGYCYDPAGNRRQVSANGGGGDNCPPLPAPTGLSVTWWTGPTWKISWNPVISATGYQIRLNNGNMLNVSGGSTSTVYSQPAPNEPPENARPDWIQACFYGGACGALAYFPN